MQVNVGIDLVRTEEVRDALDAHGSRYLRRVYSASEVQQCGEDPRRLARCFAAKEATLKAIRRQEESVGWAEIEVAQRGAQADVKLRGAAAELARAQRLTSLTVTTSGSHELAMAVALAAGDR